MHIVALHPEEKQFYYFRNGAFTKYEPITDAGDIKTIHNMEEFIEGAKEMETNHTGLKQLTEHTGFMNLIISFL